MNTLAFTGIVKGEIERKPRTSGDGESVVFKGAVGDVPMWLFGKTAEAAEELMGLNVLATGIVNSRPGTNSGAFVSPVIFGLARAGESEHNLVAFDGTIEGVRKIKDGFYSADIEIVTTAWKEGKRVKVTQTIPVATGAVTESDIGRDVTVVGGLGVRQGKFIDVNASYVTLSGGAEAGEADDMFNL